MGKISTEHRVEIEEFFASTAGSIILSRISSVLNESNSLTGALQEYKGAQHPAVAMAERAGRVQGLQQALDIIEETMEGES